MGSVCVITDKDNLRSNSSFAVGLGHFTCTTLVLLGLANNVSSMKIFFSDSKLTFLFWAFSFLSTHNPIMLQLHSLLKCC